MKVNSTTFVCTLPHIRPPTASEEDATSLSHAEEEKERLRARTKGWELLRPLEGNCMYFVTLLTNHPPQEPSLTIIEHRMVDLCILSQPLCKTIPRPITRKLHPSIPTHPRPNYRILYPRPNSLQRTSLRRRIIRPITIPIR